MPSPYSSAETQARRPRDSPRTSAPSSSSLDIDDADEGATRARWRDAFDGQRADITEENLQARIRGNLLMALSNKFGWLVLTTGNKSEMSVGYATLYGDMAGGFAVLKDVFKGWVYRLVAWRNEQRRPRARAARVLTRPPSAELRPSRATRTRCRPTTSSTRSCTATSRSDLDAEQLVRQGLPAEDVERVIRDGRPRRVQAPPGAARHPISTRAFGRDRRLPITNRYEGRADDVPERRLLALK